MHIHPHMSKPHACRPLREDAIAMETGSSAGKRDGPHARLVRTSAHRIKISFGAKTPLARLRCHAQNASLQGLAGWQQAAGFCDSHHALAITSPHCIQHPATSKPLSRAESTMRI